MQRVVAPGAQGAGAGLVVLDGGLAGEGDAMRIGVEGHGQLPAKKARRAGGQLVARRGGGEQRLGEDEGAAPGVGGARRIVDDTHA